MIKMFKNGATVKDLKKFLEKIPDLDGNGDPSEVWIGDGSGLTNQVKELSTLNFSDILLESNIKTRFEVGVELPKDVTIAKETCDCMHIHNKSEKSIVVKFKRGATLELAPNANSLFLLSDEIESVKGGDNL